MTSLDVVLRNLDAGYYLVPEIQRGFVWRNPKIRDFIMSIYNEDPVGSIVLWDPPPSVLRDENYLGIFKPLAEGLPLENGKYLVIDGQQRLTSLLLVKKGNLNIKGKPRKIELYFNPIEERFELRSRAISEDARWFNVTDVLNTDDLQNLIEEHCKDNPTLKGNSLVSKRLQRLREVMKTYDVPEIPAKLDPNEDFLSTLERMARIFINLNSTGTRVKMPDLVLALLTARTRRDIGESFRQNFESLLKELEDKGFDFDETVVIRIFSAIATDTIRFNEARKVLENKPGASIQDNFNQTDRSLQETTRLLSELGMKSAKYLESRYLVVPIAYLLHHDVLSPDKIITSDIKDDISRWLILASCEKRYTGKLETDLGSDIEQIKSGNGIKGLQNNLRWKGIQFSALEGDYENYHLTILLLLYSRLRSQDWNMHQKPSPKYISELTQEELSVHHIFPREFLEKRGIEQSYDLFGNITIISNDANQQIKDKDPKKYLKELKQKSPELLDKHCIPSNEELWDVNRYDDFVNERTKLIAVAVEREFGIKHF